MGPKHHSFLIACITALVLSVPAFAGDKDLVFCLPGFPGAKVQAQPYVEKMLRHLEAKLGWAKGSMTGAYYPDEAEGLRQLDTLKPGIALVGPSVLASRYKKLGMKVIAKVQVQGRGEEVYSVVVKADGPTKLEALSGKKITGAVVSDPTFVHSVLLGKAIPEGQATLVPQHKPLQALRAVARGQVDAAIVDQDVIAHLSELPFAKDLKVLYTAKPVPAPAVVLLGGMTKDAKKLQDVLVGLCEQADGQELCKTLTISSIKTATEADYKALLSSYGK